MDLAHLLDFDFETASVGSLRVGALTKAFRNSIEKEVEQDDVDAQDLALRVFVDAAHQVSGIKSIDSVYRTRTSPN
jgi:hypothetical protein